MRTSERAASSCNAPPLSLSGWHALFNNGVGSMTRSDAIARRQFLKTGLIVAGMPFCPEALFDGRAAADDKKAAEDMLIGPREIVKGLDGMSRVVEKGGVFGL